VVIRSSGQRATPLTSSGSLGSFLHPATATLAGARRNSAAACLGEECGDGILRIKPDRYEEVESGCRYTEVKTRFDPTIPVATKTKLGAYVSRVIAQCTGEGDKWREEATFYFSKGMLYFSRKQTR
jgi:hypothetical protein